MSPHYVDVLAKNPEKLVLGGEARMLTVMFCDIRGFTTLSEGLTPHELTHLMNSFTSPMTDAIAESGGTIDKYIGDCIMAFWNAPLDDPDHAKHAVAAARDIRRKLVELNRGLKNEAEAAGKPFHELRVGIGLNTGECVVGNFGSEQRFNYSLLGDPVNLASRLEGLCKLYTVDLVIGEETAKLLDEPALIELDLVAVKGKSQAVKVFTLPPEDDEDADYKNRHAELHRRLSPPGLERRRSARLGQGAARRGGLSCAALCAVPSPHRAFPSRGAAGRLGWRLHRRRRIDQPAPPPDRPTRVC